MDNEFAFHLRPDLCTFTLVIYYTWHHQACYLSGTKFIKHAFLTPGISHQNTEVEREPDAAACISGSLSQTVLLAQFFHESSFSEGRSCAKRDEFR